MKDLKDAVLRRQEDPVPVCSQVVPGEVREEVREEDRAEVPAVSAAPVLRWKRQRISKVPSNSF